MARMGTSSMPTSTYRISPDNPTANITIIVMRLSIHGISYLSSHASMMAKATSRDLCSIKAPWKQIPLRVQIVSIMAQPSTPVKLLLSLCKLEAVR
jgi:hypothetical protein